MKVMAFHAPLAFASKRYRLCNPISMQCADRLRFSRHPFQLFGKPTKSNRMGSLGLPLKASLPPPVTTSIVTTLAYQASFFAISSIFRTDKLTDLAGTSNIAVLALISFFRSPLGTFRHALVTTSITAWAARLGLFLFRRILRWRTDRRFDQFRESTSRRAGFWFLQAVWAWACALPATLMSSARPGPALGIQDAIGLTLFCVGFVLEAIADSQKEAAKVGGQWPRTGLWRMSRHPNYFGEILLWWGIYITAQPQLGLASLPALACPLTVSALLLFVSGVPMLESSADERYGNLQEYRRYKEETSVLLPMSPGLYRPLPPWMKKWVLFDIPLYNKDLSVDGAPE